MEIGHVVGDTARPALEILQRVPLERLDGRSGSCARTSRRPRSAAR